MFWKRKASIKTLKRKVSHERRRRPNSFRKAGGCSSSGSHNILRILRSEISLKGKGYEQENNIFIDTAGHV